MLSRMTHQSQSIIWEGTIYPPWCPPDDTTLKQYLEKLNDLVTDEKSSIHGLGGPRSEISTRDSFASISAASRGNICVLDTDSDCQTTITKNERRSVANACVKYRRRKIAGERSDGTRASGSQVERLQKELRRKGEENAAMERKLLRMEKENAAMKRKLSRLQ
jgi:hypothetical protein